MATREGPPKPEEIFIVPAAFIACLLAISKKLEDSGVKWSVIGETSELIHGVPVSPTYIEILVDKEGIEEFSSRMAEPGLQPFRSREKKLERMAEVRGEKFPVFVRSLQTQLTLKGVEVHAHSEYQTKVGEWEWGDALEFEPVETNLAGVRIPLMPVRIASEIYLMLGWMDRANMISDAVHRAHHRLDFGF